jgi:hypothetical protein
LVDGYQPVLGRGLLEKCALDSPWSGGQRPAHVWMSHYLAGEVCAPGLVQQAPRARATCIHSAKRPRNVFTFSVAQQAPNKCEAISGELHIQYKTFDMPRA